MFTKSSLMPVMAMSITLVMLYFIYQPGANGPYMFDDRVNLKMNSKLHIDSFSLQNLKEAAFSGIAGPSGRPISMLSFAANYGLADSTKPSSLKTTNILIHLVTGIAVYFLSLLLAMRWLSINSENNQALAHWIAFVVATLWLLHPLNTSTVLYVVQRMTQLSAVFCLAFASLYVVGRNLLLENGQRGWIWIVISIVVGTTLAIFSKENGALLPFLLLVIELAFFRFQFHYSANNNSKYILATLLVGPIVILVGYVIHFVWAIGVDFPHRSFTLVERLMTESRVIWFYIGQLLVPDISSMGLFHDDFVVSKGLLTPNTTILSIMGLVLILSATIYGLTKNRHQILCFGILWFIVGHSLESTVLPLELVFEHRNYLPSFGLFFMIGFLICNIKIRGNLYSPIKIMTIATVFIGLGGTLYDRVDQWSDSKKYILAEFKNHPKSARAANAMANVFFQHKQFEYAIDTYKIAAENSHNETGYLISTAIGWYNFKKSVPPELGQQIVDRISQNLITPTTWSKLRALASLNDQSGFYYQLLLEPIFRAVTKNKLAGNSPMLGLIYYELGKIDARDNQWTDAVKNWERVLKLSHKTPSSLRFLLGEGYIKIGQLTKALEITNYFKNVNLDPQEKQKLDELVEKIRLRQSDAPIGFYKYNW